MAGFLQQVVAGLASGGIYAALALAIVVVYRTTRIVNFAQGQMATFATFVAWDLVGAGIPYWGAFFLTLLVAFVGGALLERTAIRPVEGRSPLLAVIVTIGLFILLDGVMTASWGGADRQFPSAFSTRGVHVRGVVFSMQDFGVIGVSLAVVAFLWAFTRFTRSGLALRAVAVDPVSSSLVGVRVGRTRALGWGLASAVGAVAGMMAAPSVFLGPTMMQPVLLYAFGAAVLGGLDSPVGAVVGGLSLGVAIDLLGTYVHFVDAPLRLPAALVLILAVLVLRPSGLFGRARARRA